MKIIELKVKLWQQVIEAVAVFASHGNSGSSVSWEINLVQRLCNWHIISPLKFTDDERCQISSDGTCQKFGYLNPYYRSVYNVSKCRK